MANNLTQELLYFNGINGATGEYGLPPMTGDQLTKFIRRESKPENLADLKQRNRQGQGMMGLGSGVDPKQLHETGWGVIFARDASLELREALKPLLDLRAQQAGPYFKLFVGPAGYQPGESKIDFLDRHGIGPGPVDPQKVPYYLLIVGSPAEIPYTFQYQLDVQYAVGRIYFDSLPEYEHYARSVVAVETGQIKLPRQLSFFGVANPNDDATDLSAKQLVKPLYDTLKAKKPDWQITAFLQEQATKAQLTRLLGGEQTPALLFTASHGMEFPLGDPRQLPHQGALLCQDWPGPRAWPYKGALPQDYYFAGDDLSDQAGVLGLVMFCFACYSAGTPLIDEFSWQAFKERKEIAPQAFLAALPSRLLSQPGGGALAVIGHIDRAWGYSFFWPSAGKQTAVFENTLLHLLNGYPVGAATEFFNGRYAELASDLSVELEQIDLGFSRQIDPYRLPGMWTANKDARNYIIIGDPAVHLPVAAPGEPAQARRALD